MSFDPTLPANNSGIVSQELRDQFNGLKVLIDAQQNQIAALQAALDGKVNKAGMGEFDPGFSDPPTLADVQNIQAVINDMIVALNNG